jgi:hypothetical protein
MKVSLQDAAATKKGLDSFFARPGFLATLPATIRKWCIGAQKLSQ